LQSLRSAIFTPMYAMQVKQMLDGLRFAEQKKDSDICEFL